MKNESSFCFKHTIDLKLERSAKAWEKQNFKLDLKTPTTNDLDRTNLTVNVTNKEGSYILKGRFVSVNMSIT